MAREKLLQIYRGTKVNLLALAGENVVQEGELAFTTDTHELYVGRSSGLVCIGGYTEGTTVPASGNKGEFFWKSDSQVLYMYIGSSWVAVTTPIDDTSASLTSTYSSSKIEDLFSSLTVGTSFQEDVIDVVEDDTLDPGATPSEGDRYIIINSASIHTNFGTISGLTNNDIVEFDGSAWVVAYAVPGTDTDNMVLVGVQNKGTYYKFVSGAWGEFIGFSQVTAGSGIDITNKQISVKIDNDTIKIDGSGNLYADVTPGTNYVAGEAIDIDISDNINVLYDNTSIGLDGEGKLSIIKVDGGTF